MTTWAAALGELHAVEQSNLDFEFPQMIDTPSKLVARSATEAWLLYKIADLVDFCRRRRVCLLTWLRRRT